MDKAAYLEMDNLEATNWWFVSRRRILDSIISTLRLRTDSNIIEIGSGTGGNLEMLAKYGSVTAVEMDSLPLALSHNKNISGVQILQGFLPNNLGINSDRKFDLVCILDVLEHIEKDHASLIAIKKLLSPNGRLLVTVPAYQWLWSSHDEYNHHKRRYTKRGLKHDLQNAGLTVLKSSYFNFFLFPIAVFARLSEKLTWIETKSSGVTMNSVFLNHLFRIIFTSEKLLARFSVFPYGLSIWAVAEVNNDHFRAI